MEVSTPDLAEILGVGERRIQQLANEGVLRRLRHGEWLVPECVQAFIKYRLDSEAEKDGRRTGSTDEKIKLVRLRREELKLAAEERDLVPLVDALGAMSEIAGAVAFNIGAVAPGFTRDVPERDRLQKAIDDALRTVADRVEELGAALRSGCEDPEADGEDDAGPVGE